MLNSWPLFATIFIAVHSVFGQGGPVVDTSYGPVQGRTVQVETSGASVNSFHAIPFARAPINDLRFAAPQPPDPWDSVRSATELGPSCIQDRGGVFLLTQPLWNFFSEDCLHLDIVAPADTSGAPYPVMVWFHGGGFSSGANIQYPGHFLAAKDVVVVVPNYRLGNLGFLYSGDSAIPGNAGMLDQVFALQWVRDNIASFGGDPDLVTIFGESAGAASVGMHVVSPLSSGLFSGAILESGSEFSPWAYSKPEISDPRNHTLSVARKLECPTDDTAAMVECLRGVDAKTLYDTGSDCDAGFSCPGDNPVVDGSGGFLPDTPYNLRNSGEYNRVPEIVLHMAQDAALFAWSDLTDPDLPWNISDGYSRQDFVEIINYFVETSFPKLAEDVRTQIKAAADFMYSPWPYIHDRQLNRDRIISISTDLLFGYSADAQARTHALENTVYQTVYGYRTEALPNFVPDYLGAFHILELPSVFGYMYLDDNPDVKNDSQVFQPLPYTETDREYFEFISTMWTNFAKVRNPTPTPVQPPQDWPEVTWDPISDTSANYLWLDNATAEMRRDYRQQEYAFWREYLRCMTLGDVAHAPGFTSCESAPDARTSEPTRASRGGQIKVHGAAKFGDVIEKIVQLQDWEPFMDYDMAL